MQRHWGIPWWVLATGFILIGALTFLIFDRLDRRLHLFESGLVSLQSPDSSSHSRWLDMPWWFWLLAAVLLATGVIADVVRIRRRRQMK
jgi:hypothetical protein